VSAEESVHIPPPLADTSLLFADLRSAQKATSVACGCTLQPQMGRVARLAVKHLSDAERLQLVALLQKVRSSLESAPN